MDDEQLLHTIAELVEEERVLRRSGGLDDTGRARMASLEVQLDQCWDLLRRREAREEYGQNPDTEEVRSPQTVEGYEQ